MAAPGQAMLVAEGAVEVLAEEGAAGEKEGRPNDVAEEPGFGAGEGKKFDT